MSDHKETIYEEDLRVELKEFYIRVRPHGKVSYEELILSGVPYSNSLILKQLELDFIKYLPKYISGWNHDDMHLENGDMYFGVNDDGNIIGIPFTGELDVKTVKNMFCKVIPKMQGEDLIDYFNSITITITKVNPPRKETLQLFGKQIENYDKEILKHNRSLKKYIEWQIQIDYWHVKLIRIMNDCTRRSKFLEWLEEKCDHENKTEIIENVKTWKSKEKFDTPIPEIKSDDTQFYYWLCLFKDIILGRLRRSRPEIYHVRRMNLSNFYYNSSVMNYHFKRMNPEMNFYVVKLEIPNRKKPIYVKDKKKYIRYQRVMETRGPSSIPLI